MINLPVPIAAVQPVHVATWIEAATRELAAPSVSRVGARAASRRHDRANAGARSLGSAPAA